MRENQRGTATTLSRVSSRSVEMRNWCCSSSECRVNDVRDFRIDWLVGAGASTERTPVVGEGKEGMEGWERGVGRDGRKRWTITPCPERATVSFVMI